MNFLLLQPIGSISMYEAERRGRRLSDNNIERSALSATQTPWNTMDRKADSAQILPLRSTQKGRARETQTSMI